MTSPNDQLSTTVHTYLTTAPTSEFVQQTVTLHDHWEGDDNLLWRVEADGVEAVLKLYLDAGQARSRRQFDGHQLFATRSLAPRPLWYDRYPTGLARQVMVYEWAPGAPVDPTDAAALARLAHNVAQIHNTDPEDVRRFSPHPVNLDYFWRVQQGSFTPIRTWLHELNIDELAAQFDGLVQNGTELVEAARPLWRGVLPTAVHGDLKLEHCIDSFGHPMLVDWEMFGLGDAALDVARFLFLNNAALDETRQAEWLEMYRSACDQPGIEQRIAVFQRLLPFQSVCYLLDGLRTLPPDLPDRDNTLTFLQATLAATLEQATTALALGAPPAHGDVEALFGTLREQTM